MEAQDLTHAEAVAAVLAFAAEIGPKAEICVSLNCEWYTKGKPSLSLSIYPDGMSRSSASRFNAATYAELLELAKADWAKRSDTHAAKTIREMALRIISITADEGCCSELSLCKAFSAGEVSAYGDRACQEASLIGGNGPFSILRAASAVEAA